MSVMSIITIHKSCSITSAQYTPGANLMEILRENGYYLDAPCGGNGICGKCRVLLSRGGKEETVLACKTFPEGDCTVTIPDDSADLSWNDAETDGRFEQGRSGFGAAVDLGTTTVALSLYNLADGQNLGSISRWNAQKSCGADVITRIGYCIDNENGLEEMSNAIRGQISEMLNELCKEHGVQISEVKEMFLAGNTVMQHIFAGISPVSIAAAPFIPKSYFDDGKPCLLDGIPVYTAPCVAGYVGGDITAGILSTHVYRKQGKALFIDVGTNGEMALGDLSGLTACAVASGPAFEGAGISCGMPAAFGAVNKVELTEEGLCYEVLGGGEAKGLCGSGLLDLAACLLDLGYIDESGCLEDDDGGDTFYLTDEVYINQKDIRQLQLAKAAVAAGIKLLMQAEGLSFDDIDSLYLAGGFGNRLRPESAVRIGMLPKEMLGKIKPAGNTSLSGAQQALLNPSLRSELISIKENCRYIELSSDQSFNDCFVDEMSFPEV